MRILYEENSLRGGFFPFMDNPFLMRATVNLKREQKTICSKTCFNFADCNQILSLSFKEPVLFMFSWRFHENNKKRLVSWLFFVHPCIDCNPWLSLTLSFTSSLTSSNKSLFNKMLYFLFYFPNEEWDSFNSCRVHYILKEGLKIDGSSLCSQYKKCSFLSLRYFFINKKVNFHSDRRKTQAWIQVEDKRCWRIKSRKLTFKKWFIVLATFLPVKRKDFHLYFYGPTIILIEKYYPHFAIHQNFSESEFLIGMQTEDSKMRFKFKQNK